MGVNLLPLSGTVWSPPGPQAVPERGLVEMASEQQAAEAISVPTGNLGEPVLLPLRFPVSRFHHPGCVLFANQHRHGILPAVCRGEAVGLCGEGGYSTWGAASGGLAPLPKPFSTLHRSS